MFGKIARFSVRFRWLIIIFWIAAVPIVTANFPNINDVSKNNNSDFLPKNSPTDTATNLESAFQHKDTATNAIIVFSRSDGQLSTDDVAAAQQVIARVKTYKNITQIRDTGASADGQAHEYLVGISAAANGPGSETVVPDLRAKIHQVKLPTGLTVNLTGDLAAATDASKSHNQGRNTTEIYTVILIIVLLLLVFRALLAPLVTLIPAGLALAVSQPVIAESTKAGVQVGFITQILLIVLILGAGTDYGLFLVFRVREELRKGASPKEAVIKAMTRVGESITFSAATVIAALLSLLLATFGIYKGLGPALAIGLAIMLLIALTFLPAVLAVLGRAVFWPSKTVKQPVKLGLWGRLADKAITRPYTMLALGAVVFAALALGMLGYKAGGFGNQSAPKGSESAAGQAVIDQHFSAASDSPQLLIFRFNSSVWDNLSVLQQVQTKLQTTGDYKQVVGPFSANGFTLTPDSLQQLHSQTPESPILQGVSQFISPDGKTVQFYGVLKAGKSGTNDAMQTTPAVREHLATIASAVGANKGIDYSADSVAYDVNHVANNDLRTIIPLVLIIIAALLAIMLRSLVAPLYLIVSVGLSYLASMGFAMIAFVHLGHQDGLFFILPFLMFVFGMALGEDYNILVMSRIREEAHGKVTLKQAVTKAIGVTGTTVTSAGLILAGTFTILGLVGGDQSVQQIGYGVAFGILLDTFFVRTLLVPSIVVILGKWNWWPSHLYRR